jgi:tRNA (adenine37-N6)-methyltransferase
MPKGEELSMRKIEIEAIGEVRADDAKGYYALQIGEPYREGLMGLEEFGRVQVLWWAHGIDEARKRSTLSCELPYAKGVRAGVFACRAEYRPNPVDLSCCGVIEVKRKEGLMILDYIDAIDGTPVVDIKPYIPVCDRAREIKVPHWFRSWPEWIEDSGAFFAQADAPRTR